MPVGVVFNGVGVICARLQYVFCMAVTAKLAMLARLAMKLKASLTKPSLIESFKFLNDLSYIG